MSSSGQELEKKSDPPGSYGPPLIGHTVKFGRDPAKFVSGHISKYGRVFKTCVLRESGVSVAGRREALAVLGAPASATSLSSARTMVRMAEDLYGRGLGLLDGDEYSYVRERMDAAFSRGTVECCFPAVDAVVAGAAGSLCARGGVGVVEDVYEWFKELGYDVVVSLMLGIVPGTDEAHEFKKMHSAIWKAATSVPFNIPGTTYAAGQNAKVKIAAFLARRVAEQDDTHDHSTFLHMLKATPDSRGELFGDDEVALQLMWLTSPLIAKLVGSAMVTLMVMLSEDATALERARAEAQAPEKLDFAACADGMPFVRACVIESMRLEPPAVVTQRYTNTAVDTGGEFKIPKDHLIWFHVREINRDPREYEDPEVFRPTRWSGSGCPMASAAAGAGGGAAPAGAPPATATFGMGHRSCVGEFFSITLMTQILAHFLRTMSWSLEGNVTDRKYIPTSRPAKPVVGRFSNLNT